MRRRKEKTSDAAGRSVTRTLSKLFGWLAETRKITANPVAGVKAPRPAGPSRVLTDDEIQKFWRAAGQELPVFSSPLKLLLLTGCRVNEVAGLRRVELSGDASTCRVADQEPQGARRAPGPSGRRPDPCDRRRRLRLLHHQRHRPVQLGSKLKHSARRAHGHRAVDAPRPSPDRGHRHGQIEDRPHVIEAVLNHVSGAKASVAGIYNVYQYEDEKKAALERWAEPRRGHRLRQAGQQRGVDRESVVTDLLPQWRDEQLMVRWINDRLDEMKRNRRRRERAQEPHCVPRVSEQPGT